MLDDGGATGAFYNFRAVLQARMAAQQHQLHHSLRHVLEVVAGFTNGHPAFPSYETLAGITGLSAERVRHIVKTLVDLGYLARSRRPAKNGGWGQPEWSLGATCQVVTGSHSPPQVVTGDQSSGHPQPLASGHRQPQKRRVSGPTESVVQDDDGGKPRPVVKRLGEEGGAPTPRPSTNKNGRVIDLLREAGFTPTLQERDHQAIKRTPLTPEQIADAYATVASSDDALWQKNLGVAFAIGRWDAIQAIRRPANGHARLRSTADLDRHAERIRARDQKRAQQRPQPIPNPF